MSSIASGRTWEEASSPGAVRLARRFESDWRSSPSGRRPDPDHYLPSADPAACPGARLALLRAELGLRFEAGESPRVETLLQGRPELSSETLVALVYEEFCLREEAGEAPDPEEYYRRFPASAEGLRRVLDIHGLVGSTDGSLAAEPPSSEEVSVGFPKVGQTIAGFRLISELGRGSFARVFLAEERQLADRRVALKVARRGSREPHTLARLQHTHIVPVHSYRIDQATGLHLLCMPYLGGVTLARLLGEDGVKSARTGRALTGALDRLEPTDTPVGPSSSREALQGRTLPRAVAWWGARLAEALSHAHERGVLHRDVKPSNVLITADGLPMLLDFNLAWESALVDSSAEAGALGGTIAYMAPEQIEALSDGIAAGVDARADVYALGLVLYECLGPPPFRGITGARSLSDALERAAAARRKGVPRLRDVRPGIPPELDAVLMRCLAPDPAHRYGSAAELAADLQAVADRELPRHARVAPWRRASVWIRKRRIPLTLLAAAALTVLIGAKSWVERTELRAQAADLFRQGESLLALERYDEAREKFVGVSLLVGEERTIGSRNGLAPRRAAPWPWTDRRLADLAADSRQRVWLIDQHREARRLAEAFLRACEPLRLRLMGFGGPPEDAFPETRHALKRMQVLDCPRDWRTLDYFASLKPELREKLTEEVEDILFTWAVALIAPTEINGAPPSPAHFAQARSICSLGERSSRSPTLWRELAERVEALARREARPPRAPVLPDRPSARDCLRASLLFVRAGQIPQAVALLDRATRIDPHEFWTHYYLAYLLDYKLPVRDRAGALRQIEAAVAVNPSSVAARFERGLLELSLGDSTSAIEDLREAMPRADVLQELSLRHTLAPAYMMQGRFQAASAELEAVLERTQPNYPRAEGGLKALRDAAFKNRARLRGALGDWAGVLADCDVALARVPNDLELRWSRANAAFRVGREEEAEREVTRLMEEWEQARNDPRSRARLLALRGLARVGLGRVEDAEADLDEAASTFAAPAIDRAQRRVAVAAGRLERLVGLTPSELRSLPGAPERLTQDLARLADRVGSQASTLPAGTRSVAIAILAAAGRFDTASALADVWVVAEPKSATARSSRGGLRLDGGDYVGAIGDLGIARRLAPGDLDVSIRLAEAQLRSGRPEEALRLLDGSRRPTARGRELRGAVLLALDRPLDAMVAWNEARILSQDSPEVAIGQARTAFALGREVEGIEALERAADLSGGRSVFLSEVADQYWPHAVASGDWTHRWLNLVIQAALAGDLPLSR